MLQEDQARTISILSNAANGLAVNVPGSHAAVKNIIKQIEVLSAPAEVDNTIRGGEYPIDGSGWVLKVVDGAFSLHDDQGVIRLKAKANPEPETPQAEPTFEETLEKLDTRSRYGLLTKLLLTPTDDTVERARKINLVADKLGIDVISL